MAVLLTPDSPETLAVLAPGLVGFTLTQSAEGGSSLSLEFAGDPPNWAQYWAQVSVRYAGATIFTGQITSISSTNSGGAIRSSVIVQDYWFLLERATSATQISDLKAQAASAIHFKQSASKQTQSWAAMAASVRISAPGWVDSGSLITMDVSSTGVSVMPTVPRDRFYTTHDVLKMMLECNPDCLVISEPSGIIRVRTLSRCPTTNLALSSLLDVSDLSPVESERVKGICVAVLLSTPQWSRLITRQYPQNVSLTDTGVKFFSSVNTVESGVVLDNAMQVVGNHIYAQAQAWYNAVQALMWTGSVTLPLGTSTTNKSLLGYRVNISGGNDAWRSMNAPVTAQEWDFVANRVTLTLGKTIAEPMLHEIPIPVLDLGGGEPEDPSIHNPTSGHRTCSYSCCASLCSYPSYPSCGSLGSCGSDIPSYYSCSISCSVSCSVSCCTISCSVGTIITLEDVIAKVNEIIGFIWTHHCLVPVNEFPSFLSTGEASPNLVRFPQTNASPLLPREPQASQFSNS